MSETSIYSFYMSRYMRDASHSAYAVCPYECTYTDVSGVSVTGALNNVDLETIFPTLRYKSISGLDSVGEGHAYQETFAEDDRSLVYTDTDNGARQPFDITLTVYFITDGSYDEEGASSGDYSLAIKSVNDDYMGFMDFLGNYVLSYYDTCRNRVVVMYQNDSVSVTTDSLHGVVYKEVKIKFKSVFGHTFSLDEVGGVDNLTTFVEDKLNGID